MTHPCAIKRIFMKLNCIVIQMARFPKLGHVKTRLNPELGEEGSLNLYLQLLRCVHNQALQSPYANVLALDTLGDHCLVNELAQQTPVILQQGDDLGARMFNAIKWGLKRAHKVIVIGSDCVVLNGDHFDQVIRALDDHSHAFIPAEDGGYVLIAATQAYEPIFKDIVWGTGEVMEKTKHALGLGDKKAAYFSPLWDVDVAEDYHRLLRVYPNWPSLDQVYP